MSGGKYEPECNQVMEATSAAACVVIVLGGDRGNGFSVSLDLLRSTLTPAALAATLRAVACDIEGK